jgi:hypothetical protein
VDPFATRDKERSAISDKPPITQPANTETINLNTSARTQPRLQRTPLSRKTLPQEEKPQKPQKTLASDALTLSTTNHNQEGTIAVSTTTSSTTTQPGNLKA